MPPRLKLEGKRFGRLKVLRFLGMNKYHHSRWLCRCRCGKLTRLSGAEIKGRHTKSCGCLFADTHTKYGITKVRFYKIWRGMNARCGNPRSVSYRHYGARGITVCKRWKYFMNFKADMYDSYLAHEKAFGARDTTIDRVNSQKGYVKHNCRWATRLEQRHSQSNTIFLEYSGKRLILSEWARRLKMDRSSLSSRIFELNWPLEKALTTPPRKLCRT